MLRAARRSRRIAFDNEEYRDTLFNYPDNCASPEKTLAEYQAQARLRGRQIMQALAAESPRIVFLVLHGPYSSFEGTPEQVRGGQSQWENEELRGAFSAGLIEGMDSRSQFVDGGEFYVYRSVGRFPGVLRFPQIRDRLRGGGLSVPAGGPARGVATEGQHLVWGV